MYLQKKTPEMYILDKQNLQLITNFQNHYLFLIIKYINDCTLILSKWRVNFTVSQDNSNPIQQNR